MKIDKTSLTGDTPKPTAPRQPPGHVTALPRRRFTRRLRADAAVVSITLLALAFAAGVVVTRLAASRSPADAALLAPLPATAIPATPSPGPTASRSQTSASVGPGATSLEGGDVLETLYIDIAPGDYQQLAAKREEALQLGILLASGGDYVPATVRLNQQQIPVELRLKGDWVDHLEGDKWSFRVRTVGEHYVFGMAVFSLQDPSMRSFLNEWLFLEHLRQEDVLAVGYRFVHVVLNGEYKGIYALEEGFTKELLEAQARREGLIIRYDEDLVWEYRAFYDDQLIPRGINEFYIIDEFQSGHIDSDPALAAQRDVAVGMLRALWTGQRSAAEVFDLDTMGKFLALTDLWSAPHGLIWHNLRYYYNPVTARLEPIAFDSDALAGELEMAGLPQSAFYHDPSLQAAYVKALEKASQPGYVEALQSQLGAQFEALRAALAPEFGPDVLAPPWDLLRRRQGLLRQILDPYRTVYAYAQPAAGAASTTTIDVGNLLDLPVEILGLDVGGTWVPASREWVDAASAEWVVPMPPGAPDTQNALVLRPLPPDANAMPYVHLQVPGIAMPIAGAADIQIVTRLWGLSEEHRDPVLARYPSPLADGPRPEFPSVDQALAQHLYLKEELGDKLLRIDGGAWDVQGDLILPAGYGLHLSPGTALRFGRDNFLLASGPLDFQGTEEAPIYLGPAGDQWQGVMVLTAGAPSNWNYVTVQRASALSRDGWALTGGVTFYESPLRLDHCRILDSQGEDGVNVIRARFEFVFTEFANTISDAFDADFAQGSVHDSSFHDTGGDGIDVSGSEVEVVRAKLSDIGDKGISVGEASRLRAQDVYLQNVGFGVVSKDRSEGNLEDMTIANARIAGLAAYIKKSAYGPASLRARGVRFSDMPAERYTLVQTGSWIELEGRRIAGTDVDVEALYQP